MSALLTSQYNNVQTLALQFPETSALILQVYQDLALNKQWKTIQPISIPDLQTCVLHCREPGSDWLVIVPIRHDQELSLNKITQTFGILENTQLAENIPFKKLTFGIVARDSTVLYYHISKDLVPPKEH
ncbi:hypothetical protein [Absidia glauca]|uniref:tRNA-splicing endonuclease subunit Sen15 domain-containing protein n=1 Tax=Absidia glauca TaxID=4829 RepID=A0A163LT24_ABSGL|nr:hypothetical protein [Absidia glauca]